MVSDLQNGSLSLFTLHTSLFRMSQYILRRLLQMIPITFGILTLVFSLIHLIPGDPAVQIAGEGARPEDVAAVRKALGLDQPLWTQYVHYVTPSSRTATLGTSFQHELSVADRDQAALSGHDRAGPRTMFIALLVAFPLGIISAIYRNSWIDNVARFFALIGVSMPSFWFGPLLIIAFAINHEWFPVSGRDEGLKLARPAVADDGPGALGDPDAHDPHLARRRVDAALRHHRGRERRHARAGRSSATR